jgi:hypothetical protein
MLDAFVRSPLNRRKAATIAPGLLDTVPRHVDTPNKSLGLYSLTDTGREASELH